MRRGTELAKEQGIDNVHFQVICWSFVRDALVLQEACRATRFVTR